MKTYAGIGARETPEDVLDLMTRFARWMAGEGWWLRSGNADGADRAFQAGAGTKCELYLPWDRYNIQDRFQRENALVRMSGPTPDAVEMAIDHHPAPGALTRGATKLHGRNNHILLGPDLDDPVDVVVCWTKHGQERGGTGQALRVANAHKIHVINLGVCGDDTERARRMLFNQMVENKVWLPSVERKAQRTGETPRTRIFVFGSNLAGRHGAGAALAARKDHGAVYGQGVGRTGNAYGIPTKNEHLRTLPLETIDRYVRDFIVYAREHPELDFHVTRVGCGLAGYSDESVAPMFRGCPRNVDLPKNWTDLLDRQKEVE